MIIWSWRSFLYCSSVYSCHLFLISSASVRSIPFLSFIEHIFAWNVLLVSLIIFKRSLVFPILLFSSISLHWSLRKAFLSLLAILWNSHSDAYIFPFLLYFSLLFFSQLFVRPPQTAIVLFCISFPWGWSWSRSPVQYHEPPSRVLYQNLHSRWPLISTVYVVRWASEKMSDLHTATQLLHSSAGDLGEHLTYSFFNVFLKLW